MKIRTLPIGTIIRTQKGKSLIAGYSFHEVSEKLELHYVVFPYPLGFIRDNTVGLINADEVEIVSLGYEGREYELIAKYYDTLRTIASICNAKEMKQYLEDAQNLNQGGTRNAK